MRRLIWSMTDESGEIGWSAPETMAEIIVHIPELLEPYGSIMIARAFEEPPLVKGGLWGIGRLGKRIGQVIELHQNEILAAFDSDDPEIIGLAAWSMGEVGFVPALPHLKSLQSWKGSAKLFIADDFVEKPLEDWVKEAIYRIETGPTAASR
ncbi:MAG: hypothetical protein JSV02_01590 [Dehalococcoidia bacterium]|nr:MAG: hypothetical protein JSV02_01590 [Dehalococcoidia bacterium]